VEGAIRTPKAGINEKVARYDDRINSGIHDDDRL
jgi:hypothetical protein